jgi:hypothetical protein
MKLYSTKNSHCWKPVEALLKDYTVVKKRAALKGVTGKVQVFRITSG